MVLSTDFFLFGKTSWEQIFSFLPLFRVSALLGGSGIGFRVLVLYFLATLNGLVGTSLLSSSSPFFILV